MAQKWWLAGMVMVVVATFFLAAASGQQPAPSAARMEQGAKPVAAEDIPAAAWKVLLDAVQSANAPEETDAVSALATIGGPRALQLVEACLDDKDEEVRRIAVSALGEMKERASIPKLKRALDDNSPVVSFAAAQSLWEMGDRSGRDIFYEVLAGDRNPSGGVVGAQLAEVRRKLRSPIALALIGAKEGAGTLLGPFSMGISVAEAISKDRSASARALSATLLGADKDPDSVQELENALADKNWVVRAAAAKALGSFAGRDLISKLQPLLKDQKEPVRCMAAASIVRLSQAAVQPDSAFVK